jgi:hypothetical protein
MTFKVKLAVLCEYESRSVILMYEIRLRVWEHDDANKVRTWRDEVRW